MASDLEVTITVRLAGEIIAEGTNAGYSTVHTVDGLLPGALRRARSESDVGRQRDVAVRTYRALYGPERNNGG